MTEPDTSNAPTHPWRRFVALGDSFTEGVGDPDPDAPNGVRGWADRVAEQLALGCDDFAYANLAVRGKLLAQISDEQVERAIELKPDLITISAGGNDLIRPGADADIVAARFERIVERLVATGATVVLFTGVDTKFSTVAFRRIRPEVAIYNSNLWSIANRNGCVVVDQWGCKEIQNTRMWASDRLHLNEFGHHQVARLVLAALHVDNELQPMQPEPMRPQRWREARRDDLVWAREFVVPWLGRRLRGVSSGDSIEPKYPEPRVIRGAMRREGPVEPDHEAPPTPDSQ
ncbi:SGNH/GDSL hydrolase family protein [Gulosibacter macacae]|uniref:SGNH/GDSL hydrolase family protein n=1 Tax=Gulosibacter macacae TaxID=2488791 RepID=A0A3P3VXJ2_9MICO|nr:SGNH/GDSL hydrolase family protein [Gulosibacter macacae]RRJ87194.1 SGNH/GDSL hydrolase family protein [Gulosibacter macacae]